MKRNKKKSSNQNNPSPINKTKIQSLAEIYNELPPNSFSKLTITLCFLGIFAVIITSFVFLYFGIDASAITQCALLAFTAELFVLGAKTIFSKEQTANDIIFEQIKKDINDGYYYTSDGKRIKEDNSYIDNSVNTTTNNTYNIEQTEEVEEKEEIENEQESQDSIVDNSKLASVITNIKINDTQTEPKKRGRPKKVAKKEESKQEDDDTLEGESEWLDVDMSD